jgi:hypothetical protein
MDAGVRVPRGRDDLRRRVWDIDPSEAQRVTRRRVSPLAERRLRTQPRVLRPPAELVVDPTLPDEGVNAAYCPVRHQYEGVKMCADLDCGNCPLLARELGERAPDYAWACSTCTGGFKVHNPPFWADGACESCGRESPVLMLVIPRE